MVKLVDELIIRVIMMTYNVISRRAKYSRRFLQSNAEATGRHVSLCFDAKHHQMLTSLKTPFGVAFICL